ncbi:hypothetical protein L596_014322 [Steinernema carpocapsae]|uniref:Uncharacterized protein n=1 Tax=Steinernema carpocapsae TaxID=34508 RepID=A0A4U5NCE1_STECR|nr:hypothetical protein L596_014322 [Steinernema carpocapsae]
MSLPPHNFDPNDRKYRSCCCHVKSFTILFGVLEIFAICFLLVAVLPDVNTKICSEISGANVTDVDPANRTMFYTVKQLSCDMNIAWLVWAILQIFALNVMFYGMKSTRWKLFVPHIFFRFLCTGLIIALIVMALIGSIVQLQNDEAENGGLCLALTIGISFLVIVIWTYIFICEFRCCQFIKRSFETGFSISNTRPIGPSTISLSENQRQAQSGTGASRALPPLKHTYTIGRPPMYLANGQEQKENEA